VTSSPALHICYLGAKVGTSTSTKELGLKQQQYILQSAGSRDDFPRDKYQASRSSFMVRVHHACNAACIHIRIIVMIKAEIAAILAD
jgi:hypothetical protein